MYISILYVLVLLARAMHVKVISFILITMLLMIKWKSY